MLLNTLKNILTYKLKKDTTFELTEGPMEGIEQENNPSVMNNSNNTQEKNRQSSEGEQVLDTVDSWVKTENGGTNTSEKNNTAVVSCSLEDNMQRVKNAFGFPNNNDIIIRELKIARRVKAFILYVDSMVNGAFVSDFVLRELMNEQKFQDYFNNENPGTITDYISDNVISAQEVYKITDFYQLIFEALSGITVLFVEGSNQSLCIDTRGFEKRKVDKPAIEGVVYGSQEGFTENMRTNVSQIRKYLKNQKLHTEIMKTGTRNQSFCAIMYLEDIANPEVVKEVKRRLQGIDADFVFGSGMISQFIEDHPYSLLPQVLNTERPDRVASYLVEGKIAIVSEGMPLVDIIPVTFYHLLQSSEDAMLRWQYGTFLRIIRLAAFIVTTLLPGLYIALILFHQEAIPTELLSSIARSKEEVPFPTLVEMLLLEVAFELIREGSIRVPGVIGQTLGIVGALILGQAAVTAKLVSPIMIIIVSVTGIGSFALPNYPIGLGFRIIKFGLIFLAAFMGLYGICAGIFIIGIIACSMKSFGVPYFSPVAPKTTANPDLYFKGPAWKQKIRPDYLNVPNRQRQGNPARKWTNKGKGSGTQ